MRRFYLPPEEAQSELLTLTGSEAHHAADVLRVRVGEELAVLDGAGRELICRVAGVAKKLVQLHVERTITSPPPPCRLTLLQAIPKGKILESIIEKSTELGVHTIIPVLSERVATRLEAESAAQKGQKWQHTAIEAIKQCGQRWLPKVEEPQTLRQALEATQSSFDLALVGSLQGDGRHPREYFGGQPWARVAVWIGPEGDFSAEELDAIRQSGARPITLGPLILRSETAAIYALSVINYEIQWARRADAVSQE